MNSVMKKEMNKYQVLALFVLFSIVLFFITRLVMGMIYSTSITNDIIGQFTNAIDIANKAIGVYLLLLFTVAIVGLSISRIKGKPECVRGFKFSLMFCGVLTVVYLMILLGT